MLEENVLLAPHTSLQVGGPAEFFVVVDTEDELQTAAQFAKKEGMTFRVIGGGTNILVPDNGLKGLTIKNAITKYVVEARDTEIRLCVGAGEVFDDVIAKTVAEEYWGLENLSHIPGSVGATPVQNVGAYGVEVADCIESVRVLNTESMQFEMLQKTDCHFGYRDSIFKHDVGKKYIIVDVCFKLSKKAVRNITYKDLARAFANDVKPTIAAIREAVIMIRSGKFPDWQQVGTAGSFFKNPFVSKEKYEELLQTWPDMPGFVTENNLVKIPLGWILDKVCTMRGVTEGNVGTYEKQALVLIQNGNASAKEITDFANTIVQTVEEKTGITIEWEVTRLS